LLAVLKAVSEQVAQLDRLGIGQARQDAMCRHLMSIPGVGVLTALAFMTAVDDPNRFRKSRSVGAFLGLTPKRYQSGEIDREGRISKCGDALARAYLYEAANALLINCKKWSPLLSGCETSLALSAIRRALMISQGPARLEGLS
jgi:transposase